MRYSALQCVAECCNVLQVCFVVLQCVAVRGNALQCVAVCCSVLQYVIDSQSSHLLSHVGLPHDLSFAVRCSALQCVAVYCSMSSTLNHLTY